MIGLGGLRRHPGHPHFLGGRSRDDEDHDAVAVLMRRLLGAVALVLCTQAGALETGASIPELALPRLKVEGGEGTWLFRLLCHGALDRWGWVDRNLWRWQQRVA